MNWLVVSLACGGTPEVETPKEETVEVREDRASLERHIAVPEGYDTVRWVARAKGTVGLGPTDLVLLAWFPADEVDLSVLGDSTGTATVHPDEELARALGITGSVDGATYSTTAFENIRWRGGFAVVADEGLLVELHSN
ncbi:MAG TPA: hypothetical protein QGF58_24965 [Myxococcota bacterium]|nr:hypothetical protein [Myxococcota bacterium]